jgi:hypothetical protein
MMEMFQLKKQKLVLRIKTNTKHITKGQKTQPLQSLEIKM